MTLNADSDGPARFRFIQYGSWFLVALLLSSLLMLGCGRTDPDAEIAKMNEETKEINRQIQENNVALIKAIDGVMWDELVKAVVDGKPEEAEKAKATFFATSKAADKLVSVLKAENTELSKELEVVLAILPDFVAHAKSDETTEVLLEPLSELTFSAVPEIQRDALQTLLQSMESAIGYGTSISNAYVGRGHSRSERNELQTAIDDFGTAVKLDPKNEAAYIGRSNVWLKQERFEKSISDLTQAIDLNSQNWQTRFLRAFARHELGDNKGAVEDLKAGLELNPGNAQMLKLQEVIEKSLDVN